MSIFENLVLRALYILLARGIQSELEAKIVRDWADECTNYRYSKEIGEGKE